MRPGEEPGTENLKDVASLEETCVFIFQPNGNCYQVKESKCSHQAAPHHRQSLLPSLRSQSGLLGCLT